MSSGTPLFADTDAGIKPKLTLYVKLRPARRIYEAFTFAFISEFVFTNFTTPNSSHYADATFITGAHPADANEVIPSQRSGYCSTAGCITDWHNVLFMDIVGRLKF